MAGNKKESFPWVAVEQVDSIPDAEHLTTSVYRAEIEGFMASTEKATAYVFDSVKSTRRAASAMARIRTKLKLKLIVAVRGLKVYLKK